MNPVIAAEEEKLAEEYVREIKAIANDSKVRIDRIVDKTKDAFIAGYMKGLPKWHKIADGDLPEEDSTCLVRCDNGNGYKYTSILKYDEYDEELHWLDDEYETFDDVVIAWCEIPKFEED